MVNVGKSSYVKAKSVEFLPSHIEFAATESELPMGVNIYMILYLNIIIKIIIIIVHYRHAISKESVTHAKTPVCVHMVAILNALVEFGTWGN